MRDELIAAFRPQIVAHCYRMLGSIHDAEDMAQDVFVRAWNAAESFEERASIETWLYRIATNRCLDELKRAGRRRERPVDTRTRIDSDDPVPPAGEPARWITPLPDPEASVGAAEHVQLAFIAALQRLSPRQRAVLLLRDVLGWAASEVASALDTTVASINSALVRARDLVTISRARPLTDDDRALLARYVEAWTTGDASAFAQLLADRATFSMPPNPAWLRGRDAIARFFTRIAAERRFVPLRANGTAAFAVYVKDRPHSIQVITLARGRVTDITSFHDPSLFARFGLDA